MTSRRKKELSKSIFLTEFETGFETNLETGYEPNFKTGFETGRVFLVVERS